MVICRGVGLALVVGLGMTACSTPSGTPATTPNLTTLSVGHRSSDGGTPIDLRHTAGVMHNTVPASLASVWSVLPAVLEQLEIEVAHVDAGSGIIGNPSFQARRIEGERMSAWLDCGRGPLRANADTHQVTLSVMIQLLPAERGTTTVRTTVDAYARDRSASGGSVHCVSGGNIERRVAELVMELIEA